MFCLIRLCVFSSLKSSSVQLCNVHNFKYGIAETINFIKLINSSSQEENASYGQIGGSGVQTFFDD